MRIVFMRDTTIKLSIDPSSCRTCLSRGCLTGAVVLNTTTSSHVTVTEIETGIVAGTETESTLKRQRDSGKDRDEDRRRERDRYREKGTNAENHCGRDHDDDRVRERVSDRKRHHTLTQRPITERNTRNKEHKNSRKPPLY